MTKKINIFSYAKYIVIITERNLYQVTEQVVVLV